MHFIQKDCLQLSVPTLVTDVTDDACWMMAMFLGNHVESFRLDRPDLCAVKEWRNKVRRDHGGYVDRPVLFYAFPSTEVIGAGKISISQVSMAHDLHVDVQSITAARA